MAQFARINSILDSFDNGMITEAELSEQLDISGYNIVKNIEAIEERESAHQYIDTVMSLYDESIITESQVAELLEKYSIHNMCLAKGVVIPLDIAI